MSGKTMRVVLTGSRGDYDLESEPVVYTNVTDIFVKRLSHGSAVLDLRIGGDLRREEIEMPDSRPLVHISVE